jgi:hypothetical protein
MYIQCTTPLAVPPRFPDKPVTQRESPLIGLATGGVTYGISDWWSYRTHTKIDLRSLPNGREIVLLWQCMVSGVSYSLS